MKVPRLKLAQLIRDRATSDEKFADLSREIAAYLLQEGRTGELNSLMRDVIELRAEQGEVEAIATSAFPLSDESKSEIMAVVRELYPTAKSIVVSEAHDANVIGGTKLVIANRQLDVSVRSKLNHLKQLTAVTGGN